MKISKYSAILLGFGVGAFIALAVPSDWFLYLFLSAISAALLLGIVCTVGGKERPLGTGLKVISYVLLGTSRPNSIVKPNAWLLWFHLLAGSVFGMAIAIICVSNM